VSYAFPSYPEPSQLTDPRASAARRRALAQYRLIRGRALPRVVCQALYDLALARLERELETVGAEWRG
jgi:hypothetical protein